MSSSLLLTPLVDAAASSATGPPSSAVLLLHRDSYDGNRAAQNQSKRSLYNKVGDHPNRTFFASAAVSHIRSKDTKA